MIIEVENMKSFSILALALCSFWQSAKQMQENVDVFV